MVRIDPEAARAFASRWRLVAAAEREELRRTDAREVEEVRARWNRLATIYRG